MVVYTKKKKKLLLNFSSSMTMMLYKLGAPIKSKKKEGIYR